MKPRLIFCIVFLAFCVSGLTGSEKGPVAVSPGLDGGVAVVGERCPTFSWTAVEWATAYRITVFEAVTAEVMSYERMTAMAYPLVSKEIQGRALSWTPSADEQLSNGGVYIWYVQAMDAYGTAKWSEGKVFKVEVIDRLARIGEKLSETLKEYGVSEEVISDVLREIDSELEEINIGASGSQRSGYKTTDRIGIQGNEVGSNTWYGEYAGASLTTGGSNTFMGQYAGYNNDAGYHNTFIGYVAGNANTTGGANTFIGRSAGASNNADKNTFIGHSAGAYNTTGYRNTFMGQVAGYSNTTGGANTFMGMAAGYWNTTGSYNTFIGRAAGYDNTTGSWNTFIGQRAGYFNTTGRYNTFIGQRAGYKNDVDSNTFIGYYSGYSNTTGSENTFMGRTAGYSNTTGNHNIFMGRAAGYWNTTGNDNTFIGKSAGFYNETGYGNIFLGHKAGLNEAGSNKLYIDNSDNSSPLIYGEFDSDIVAINGKLGVGTQSPNYNLEVETTGKNAFFVLNRTDGAKTVMTARSNMAAFGTLTNHPLLLAVNSGWMLRLNTDNSLLMSNGAQCTAGGVWQDASSREYKENIQDLTFEEAKDVLSELNPVKYTYKKDKEDEHLGFIAEDVPELVASKDRKGMSPMDVVAVLTKAVQEQQETITDLQERIAELEKRSEAEK